MKSKVFTLRAIRKSAHLTNKAIHKGLSLTTRIENKSTRLLNGTDYSGLLEDTVPFEKVLFTGLDYNIAPLNPALPAVGRSGAVTLLIPSLSKGSFFGGTATALIFAGKLAVKQKMPLRIIETLRPGGKRGLGDFFSKNKIPIAESDIELIDVSARTYNRYGYVDLHQDDIYIASAWWDAYLLDKLPLPRKYIYLIQDFEPIFYANSDEYVLAENTYRSDKFLPVCNTELMYTFMSKRYSNINKNGLWFEPAVSLASKGLVKENKSKRRLFLYGRPNVARNLFYTGLSSLNEAFEKGILKPDEWDLYMAGEDKLPSIVLSSGAVIENLGKMTIEDYHSFARTVDLTLSLMMAPHPNYPTLELSSIGSAVVTTRYETKQDLSKYSKNIFLADLSQQSIVEAIGRASDLSYADRKKNAEKSSIADDWDMALNQVIKETVAQL